MAFLPATQFCCGCSVPCGVNFIVVLNLLLNVFLITTISANLIWENKSTQIASFETEIVLLLIALAGLPCIVAAFNGVSYKNEAGARIYLYYMNTVFAIILGTVFYQFLWKAGCRHLPIKNSYAQGTVCGASGMFFKDGGQAFACGMAHILDYTIVIMTLAILGYFQHVVWSFVEDLNAPATEYYSQKWSHYEKARNHRVSTKLHAPAQEGDTKLNVASTTGFLKGKPIVIDPNTRMEETNFVDDFGSMILRYPLQYDHDVLADILQEGVWESKNQAGAVLHLPKDAESGRYEPNMDFEPSEITNLMSNKGFYQGRHQPRGADATARILSETSFVDPEAMFKREFIPGTAHGLDRDIMNGADNPGFSFFSGRYHEMAYPVKGASVAEFEPAEP
jgi:hypothetical protein